MQKFRPKNAELCALIQQHNARMTQQRVLAQRAKKLPEDDPMPSLAACLDDSPLIKDAVEGIVSELCILLEMVLFNLVDWVMQTEPYKHLPVKEMMQILYSAWSEIILLEFVHAFCMHTENKQCKDGECGSLSLPKDHPSAEESAAILSLADDILSVVVRETDTRQRLSELLNLFYQLGLDREEFVCLKFLVLFNPAKHDVILPKSWRYMQRVQNELSLFVLRRSRRLELAKRLHEGITTAAELESPAVRADIAAAGATRFGQIMLALSEVKFLAFRMEAHLLNRYWARKIPQESLLYEMLIKKRERFQQGSQCYFSPQEGHTSSSRANSTA
ncbi:hypothetical protein Ciccas_002328 [Cichlidogyrus casuarinus]|uniref:NR LBD domain-containing protein n=1 Tax=Cichlidogyrus casuarinus TaxID=1844966 RepID=A0ABD2QHJ3_9PLAT